jgi:hypothetical protein
MEFVLSIELLKLNKYFSIDKLIYHSIDLSLYQVSAIIDGEEQYITDGKKGFLRASNIIDLQKLLKDVKAKETVLRHTSAYDEMVGGPEKVSSNLLEVPLADNKLY